MKIVKDDEVTFNPVNEGNLADFHMMHSISRLLGIGHVNGAFIILVNNGGSCLCNSKVI